MAKIKFPKNPAPVLTLDPILRQTSQEVSKDMINDPKFQDFLEDMIDYVYGHKRSEDNQLNGRPNVIGLAAVQLGVPLRVCVVDLALNMESEFHDMRIIVNPKIITVSKEKDADLESCVSCPEMWATVNRPKVVTIDCWDRWGNKMRIEGKADVAKLFQHEVDHMNGHLFIDRVSEEKIHWVKDGDELKHYRGGNVWHRIVPQEMYGKRKFLKD